MLPSTRILHLKKVVEQIGRNTVVTTKATKGPAPRWFKKTFDWIGLHAPKKISILASGPIQGLKQSG